MQGMFKRWITKRLEKSISRNPAVALLGPRQVGKTTLAKTLARDIDSIYLDLEYPKDLVKLQDPTAYLQSHRDKLIILDEIQRAPELFAVLRSLIDQNRQAGRKAAQFFILGSASMELLRQSSESLAGRISYVELTGLNLMEVGTSPKAIRNLWLRGGFPSSYLAEDNDASIDWLENFIITYLERDVPQMGFRVASSR